MLNCKLCSRGPIPPKHGCFCDYGKVKLTGINDKYKGSAPKSVIIESDNPKIQS